MKPCFAGPSSIFAAVLAMLCTDAAAQAPGGGVVSPEAAEALDRLAGGAQERPLAVPGEFIIDRSRVSGALPVTPEALAAQGASPLVSDANTGLDLVSVESDEAAERLRAAYGEAAVLPHYLLYTEAVPNDPRAGELWMIEAINAAAAWSVFDDASSVTVAVIDDGMHLDHEDLAGNVWVNEDEILGNGRDDDANGFIDDGYGWDFGENDNDPNPEPCGRGAASFRPDLLTHGTHVAGTIGAVGDNARGVIGVAPKVRLMALKVGTSRHCRALSSFGVLRALVYAVQNGAKVINMSLGGPISHPMIEDLYRRVGAAGVLMVVSAGNEGISNDLKGELGTFTVYQGLFPGMTFQSDGRRRAVPTLLIPKMGPGFPASYDVPEIISVAAAEPREDGSIGLVEYWSPITKMIVPMRRWSGVRLGLFGPDFSQATVSDVAPGETNWGSNFGPRTVDIAAPGQGILSTVPLFAAGGLAPGYDSYGGTSMAAPHVAGAAALLFAAFPSMTPVDVKTRLMATARKMPSLEGKVASGGLLDLYAALCAPGAPRALPGCEAAAPSADVAASPAAGAPGGSALQAVELPTRRVPLGAMPSGGAATAGGARAPAPAEEERPGGSGNLNEVIDW